MILHDFPRGRRFHHLLAESRCEPKNSRQLFSRFSQGPDSLQQKTGPQEAVLKRHFLDYEECIRKDLLRNLDALFGRKSLKTVNEFISEYLEFRSIFKNVPKKVFTNYFYTLVECGIINGNKSMKEVRAAHENVPESQIGTLLLVLSPLISTHFVKTSEDVRDFRNAILPNIAKAEKSGIDFFWFFNIYVMPVLAYRPVNGERDPRRIFKIIKNAGDFWQAVSFLLRTANKAKAQGIDLRLPFYQLVLPELEDKGVNSVKRFMAVTKSVLKQ